MRNFIAALFVLFVFVTACTPVSAPESPATLSPLGETGSVTVTPIENTQVPATATLLPTTAPTPTALPVRFDRAGYRQFAISSSYFQGLADYYAERSFSQISSAFSPDGNLIAISACWGSISNVWTCETLQSGFLVVIDVNTGEIVNDIPLGGSWPGPMAFTSDSKSLLFSTHEQKVTLWDLAANKPERSFLNATASGRTLYPDVAVAPDDSSMSAVTKDTLYVWNPSGELLLKAPAFNSRANAALAYSADGSRLTLFSPDQTGMDVYNTSDWKLMRRIDMPNIFDGEISPDGRLIAEVNSPDVDVAIWDVDSGKQLTVFTPELRVTTLQFNPAGDLLIVAGWSPLGQKDDYSIIGDLYETRTWSRVDTLYSFITEGKFRFNRDGSRMAVLGVFGNTVWGLPDTQLQAGFEVVQQFQGALAAGDYDTAASLFDTTGETMDYLAEQGFDANDLAGSFSLLCEAGTIFCLPVKELVMMGYDYEPMTYLVRLEDPSGGVFTSPEGATIQYIYLDAGSGGQPRVIYPAME